MSGTMVAEVGSYVEGLTRFDPFGGMLYRRRLLERPFRVALYLEAAVILA
jgi:hypothetical protein